MNDYSSITKSLSPLANNYPMRNSFAFINPELKKQRAPTEITSVIELRSSNATFEESPHMPNAIDLSATVTLLQKMAQDEFVAGETSESERCIEKTSETYGWPDTMRWLNTVYLDNFSNPAVLIGLMHCLSHFEYDDVKPEGPTMALGVLQHSDIFVRDYAIRAFENWGDKEAIPILKSLSCDAKWLQEYINEVVKELEEQ